MEGKVVTVAGRELLMFDLRDMEETFRRKPFLVPCKAYLDRVREILFVLKRLTKCLNYRAVCKISDHAADSRHIFSPVSVTVVIA
jgi:hypothetical protein